MKFLREFYERHHVVLGKIYAAEPDTQFRASNLCNLIFGFGVLLGALLGLTILYDITSMTPKRLFYMASIGAMLLTLSACLRLTRIGHFNIARFIFVATNVAFVVPSVLFTGGVIKSPSMALLLLPILFSFCLYRTRKSILISIGFIGVIVLMMVLPDALNVTLPDYSTGEFYGKGYSRRKVINSFILLGLMFFTLTSLQYENQRALKKARAAADAKTEFLANMSHEIRTPMNGVIGLTEVLMTKSMPEDQKRLLRAVHSSGQALITIINDILDFSKLNAGQVDLDPQPFVLTNVLRDIGQLMKHNIQEKDLYLRLNYAADCPKAFIGDDGRIRQILLNLIGNAIKFTKDGGVTVIVSMPADGPLRLDVKDTGIGISQDKLSRLFKEFSQADNSTTRVYGGTGLGLAISQKLARAMDGDISVSSVEGEGSTFTALLPLQPVELVRADPASLAA